MYTVNRSNAIHIRSGRHWIALHMSKSVPFFSFELAVGWNHKKSLYRDVAWTFRMIIRHCLECMSVLGQSLSTAGTTWPERISSSSVGQKTFSCQNMWQNWQCRFSSPKVAVFQLSQWWRYPRRLHRREVVTIRVRTPRTSCDSIVVFLQGVVLL